MLIGETGSDYFVVKRTKCGEQTKNEYLGKDPVMTHFKAVCPKCRDLGRFKLDVAFWRGMPASPDHR